MDTYPDLPALSATERELNEAHGDEPDAPEDGFDALQYVSAEWLHRSLVLPSTASRESLRITFAVNEVSNSEDQDVPTILFCGGMFGGRWMATMFAHLAQKNRVRVVVLDRPGMGGSTPVPVPDRISIFLETVPVLLTHLQIPHVHLASHSCGVLFLFNMLYQLPHLVSPNLRISVLAPWVHPSQSQVFLMSLVERVPNVLIGGWNQLIKRVLNVSAAVGPVVTGSGDMLSILWSKKNDVGEEGKEAERQTFLKTWGLQPQDVVQLNSVVRKCLFEEDTTGGNDEALLCMKKAGGTWGVCDDYTAFVPKLVTLFKERNMRVQMRAFFAEDDMMIGNQGRLFFKECFEKAAESAGDVLEFKSVVIKGTDHNNLLAPELGCIESVFEGFVSS